MCLEFRLERPSNSIAVQGRPRKYMVTVHIMSVCETTNKLLFGSIFRELPLAPTPSSAEKHKRDSRLSKMVTTVPPCNPFNTIKKEEV
jgi:hypothetical protein